VICSYIKNFILYIKAFSQKKLKTSFLKKPDHIIRRESFEGETYRRFRLGRLVDRKHYLEGVPAGQSVGSRVGVADDRHAQVAENAGVRVAGLAE